MLRVEHLTKSYDQRIVLKDLSFSLAEGECVLLAGGCGSGKSVLLRILAQLENADKGQMWWHKNKLEQNKFAVTTLLMQDAAAQLLGQTVEEDLYLWPIMAGKSHEESVKLVQQTLETFQLVAIRDHLTATLSGGQMRLVLLAGIFMQNTPILLLDEPFANLDYPAVLQVRSTIKKLLTLGKTLVIATHEIEKVITLANRIIVMHAGEIAYQQDLPLTDAIEWRNLHLKSPYEPAWQW